jgi:MFS family permease
VKTFASLNRQQREAVGLLQIGTFLEYFDLMLYVHMAVLLNELFFPATDPHTASLITAFAFCSTFVLRPFGALIFGYIGDNYGRKITVVFTTILMSLCCLTMANMPTYAEIGITAAWLVTICRIVQGLTSMGEVMGAEIYVTELVKPPHVYKASTYISLATSLGALAALGVASLVTKNGFNWRLGFWMGATIAVVGSMARSQLREAPDFADAKKRMSKKIEDSYVDGLQKVADLLKKSSVINNEKINLKTGVACLLAYCGWPLCFYMSYMFFNPILKNKFGYSSEDIIHHNFFLAFIPIISAFVLAKMSQKTHPLKILKYKGMVLLFFVIPLPFLINMATTTTHIFIYQCVLLSFALGTPPASTIFISHFPIFKRFTAISFNYALSRAVTYVITTFSLVYLCEIFNYYGILIVMLPVILGHLWGVAHFQKLENKSYAL